MRPGGLDFKEKKSTRQGKLMSFLSLWCPRAVGKASMIQFNNSHLKGPNFDQTGIVSPS